MQDYRIAVGRVFLLAALLALLPTISALADQIQIRSYSTARRLVWGLLYASGGFLLPTLRTNWTMVGKARAK